MHARFLALMLASAMISPLAVSPAWSAEAKAKEEKTEKAAEAKAEDKDYTVVKYDGGKITRDELNALWHMIVKDDKAPSYDEIPNAAKIELLRNLTRERLVLEKAYAANIDKTEALKEQIEYVTRKLVAQEYLKSIIDTLVPEKDIKKEYNALAEKFKGKQEVHARHILVENEDEAKEIAKKLKDGADFAELAKEKSADTGSSKRGGDLGFFVKERMVPQFSEAAFKLDKGEVSEPVQTDFGWHIIEVLDKRDIEPPKYADVKDALQERLAGPAVESYLKTLESKAKPKYFNPDGSTLKAEETKKEEAKMDDAKKDDKKAE